jgi:hypothetical protein
MPKFKVTFQRQVHDTDEVVRTIEADDIESARRMAAHMADEFNSDCPEDVYTIAGGECDDWWAEEVEIEGDE